MLSRLFGKKNKKNSKRKNKEEKKNEEIGEYLRNLANENRNTVTLLLIGPSGSGKTSILKQCEKIYESSIDPKLLRDSIPIIHKSILQDIYDLCTQNAILKASNPQCQLTQQSQAICMKIISTLAQRDCKLISGYWRINCNAYIVDGIIPIIIAYHKCSIMDKVQLTPKLGADIAILWNDNGLQETYKICQQNYKTNFADHNTAHFLNNIERISNESYIPNLEDYVRVKHKTEGIIKTEFSLPGSGNANNENIWKFRIIDTNGHSIEEILRFVNVWGIWGIIFTMNLASYDNKENGYGHTLDMFEQTMSHTAFSHVNCMVFLNKNDQFIPKIKQIPFSVYDPDFNHDLVNNANAVKDYLRHKFKKIFYNGTKAEKSPRRIHFHVTCAIDTSQLETVMHLIQFETVRKMMRVS